MKAFTLPSLATLLALAFANQAAALDKVSFATNWLAEAEHGGFYQAVADGTYAKYGLEVTIVQGGPQTANQTLLLADKVQFYMRGNFIGAFSAAEQKIPVIEVAAIFQKDPQVMIVHPDSGIGTFADLAKAPVLYLARDFLATGFEWMKAAYPALRDEQVRPYAFNPTPFLANKASSQQGYVTSEPYEIERQGGFKPRVFLLADYGYSTPSTTIEAKADYVTANPDIVQRFVDASIVGWYNYLYGDSRPGNALIKKENPEMTDGQIAFSIAKIKEHGLVDSGAAATGGIGCLSSDQVKDFYDKMVAAKVVTTGFDYTKTFTTRFTCKRVGVELRK
ncbi:MAG: ABC transporter substrate-binding protein [Bauldia sp.]